ncbi:hypothetical protein BaRGS_00011053 [Batillaria attramentaria]|uniref:Uncharacterized protein n=1 Tax=Batillaria attramentaria TaxID=370345 RepID=A0ABD0LEL7_9CAEN
MYRRYFVTAIAGRRKREFTEKSVYQMYVHVMDEMDYLGEMHRRYTATTIAGQSENESFTEEVWAWTRQNVCASLWMMRVSLEKHTASTLSRPQGDVVKTKAS